MRADVKYKTYQKVKEYFLAHDNPILKTKIRESVGIDANSIQIAINYLLKEGFIKEDGKKYVRV